MTSRINVSDEEIYFIKDKQQADLSERLCNFLLYPVRMFGGHTSE